MAHALQIATARNLLSDKALGVVARFRLAVAIDGAESAYTRLQATRDHMRAVLVAIEATLETGCELAGHGFRDGHYSKVSVVCAAIAYRKALRQLADASADATTDIVNFRDLMRRAKFSG